MHQSGSAIAGASVIARNQGTSQTRKMLTNGEGFFRVSELPVGQYKLRVEAPGFAPGNVDALNQFYGAERSPLREFATPNKAGIPRQLQFSIDLEF